MWPALLIYITYMNVIYRLNLLNHIYVQDQNIIVWDNWISKHTCREYHKEKKNLHEQTIMHIRKARRNIVDSVSTMIYYTLNWTTTATKCNNTCSKACWKHLEAFLNSSLAWSGSDKRNPCDVWAFPRHQSALGKFGLIWRASCSFASASSPSKTKNDNQHWWLATSKESKG